MPSKADGGDCTQGLLAFLLPAGFGEWDSLAGDGGRGRAKLDTYFTAFVQARPLQFACKLLVNVHTALFQLW